MQASVLPHYGGKASLVKKQVEEFQEATLPDTQMPAEEMEDEKPVF